MISYYLSLWTCFKIISSQEESPLLDQVQHLNSAVPIQVNDTNGMTHLSLCGVQVAGLGL